VILSDEGRQASRLSCFMVLILLLLEILVIALILTRSP
jgi:hypothetical protein